MEWKVIIPAVCVILGALITGAITIVLAIVNNANNRKLEKIKIHTSPKLEALQRLMLFATKMRNSSFPLAENKIGAFMDTMNQYSDEILSDALYFDQETQGILDEFDENYVCLNRSELLPETHHEVQEFIETELHEKAGELRKCAKKQADNLL